MSHLDNNEKENPTAEKASEIVPPGTTTPNFARPPRRSRASGAGLRGLPEEQIIRNLAVVYLTEQRRHWPELAKRGLIPDPVDAAAVEALSEQFGARHAAGRLPELDPSLLKNVPKFAACYSRYSCDNSSPTSVADQLVNELKKARAEDRFVPWGYVFADYAISGLDRNRTDYINAKNALADPQRRIDTLYIDDFSRASRDELEWWRLAAHIRRHQKRLVGATDGFDLTSSMGDIQVTMFALLSKLFVKGLREKVGRGMRGAASRGTSTGKAALGITHVPITDGSGEIVNGADGAAVMKYAIDPETRQYVELAFKLYGEEVGWSYCRIAKRFNELNVGGHSGWTAGCIRKLLARTTYIGVVIYNKIRQERDPDTNKIVTIKNPRREWVIKKTPELRIISDDLWKKVRRRADRERRPNPVTGKRISRNERCAATLFSGTLVCGSCGHEIVLARSGKYKVMACRQGTHGTHNCKLDSNKSVRIVEECLLGYIKDRLLSETNARSLVQRANEAVERELAKPPEDLAPLEAERSKLERRKDRLVKLLAGEDTDEGLLGGLKDELKQVQQRLNQVGCELREAAAKRSSRPKEVQLQDVMTHLAQLRMTLAGDVPAAAEAIRRLTGKIRITHRKVPGQRGAVWIAHVRPLVAGLLDIPADSEHASAAADEVQIVIGAVAKAVKLEARVRGLLTENQKISVSEIAERLGIPWLLARDAYRFVTTGELPVPRRPTSRRIGGRANPCGLRRPYQVENRCRSGNSSSAQPGIASNYFSYGVAWKRYN